MLTAEILEQFWSLAKTDLKVEIYKIINEISAWLKQNHIDYIFDQIKQVQPEKMATDEFHTISELGKFSRDLDFKKAVSEFFWSIICSSDSYKEDLVTNCITKFSEMVKYWDMPVKHQFFIDLQTNID